MADTLDDLDKEFGTWKPGTVTAPQSFDDLDKYAQRKLKAVNSTYAIPDNTPRDKTVTDDDFKGSTLQFGPIDTGLPIPASVGRGLAQIGSGMADLPMGLRQILGKATTADVDEKRSMDDPLNKGVLGTINNLAGKALPFAAAPYGAAHPLLEGATMGAIQGMTEPVGKGESRAVNTGVGGVAGAIPAGLLALARRGATPSAENASLVQSALREGIPLGIGDTTENKMIKAFKSIGNDVGANAGVLDDQQKAFNAAVGRRWGSQFDNHNSANRAIDKKRITDVMEDVWGKNDLPYDANVFGAFRKMEADASLYPGETRSAIQARIADLEKQVVQGPNGDLYIPGKAAKEAQTDLFKLHGNKAEPDALDQKMMELRGTILDNFNANVHPDDKARLDLAREQYRAWKTAQKALEKGEAGVASRKVGDITPADLSSSIVRNYKDAANTPFGDLGQIGQRYLRDDVDRRGGSIRALLQNAGVGGAAMGLGGVALGAGAVVPALAGAGAFTGATKLLNSPNIRRLIMNEAGYRLPGPASAAAREGIRNVARQLPAAGALGAVESFRPPEVEVRGTRDSRADGTE